ncbi:MAG UNVERIFIED_CONTAM: hypothetical protein LVR29_16665 [Microcystis novacekii LVE1205-3]|jgi:non-ribosomal peptide synthetase component F
MLMDRQKPAFVPRYKEWTDETLKVTIGRPIANTQVYILDSHFTTCPDWCSRRITYWGYGISARVILTVPN